MFRAAQKGTHKIHGTGIYFCYIYHENPPYMDGMGYGFFSKQSLQFVVWFEASNVGFELTPLKTNMDPKQRCFFKFGICRVSSNAMLVFLGVLVGQ